MEEKEKSKMDAYIPQIREHAYYTEKTRRDYLQQCSDYYDKYLFDFLMKEKRFWMMNEEMKAELEMRDHENGDEHVKKCKLYRKCSRQKESKKQEKEKEQQQEMKKKKKKRSTGRPRGRPRIHPKKQLMSITMEDLRSKASDPFGAERVKKKSKKEKKKKSMEDAAAAVGGVDAPD